MTVYCYDTEFLEDGKTIELISIGIVDQNGREYYAVNGDMDEWRVRDDDWLVANVWPHLPTREITADDGRVEEWLDWSSGVVKSREQIAKDVGAFLLGGVSAPELWAYYAAYDHVALAQLWGKMIDLPAGIPMYTHDLKQEMDRLGVSENSVPNTGDEHDALADARWNRSMWAYLQGVQR